MSTPQHISSRDNPLVQRLRRLASETTAYRRQGQVWLEGEHLCTALRSRGLPAAQAVVTEDAWQQPALRQLASWAAQVTTVPSTLFKSISGLESPASIGFLFDLPLADAPLAGVNTVVLDRLQDAGNVGSILRSAAALGFLQVLALKGTAGLWSPKVLRAGMGAHFALRLVEGLDEGSCSDLAVPLVATSSHGGSLLQQAALPMTCAWVLGHEGQGVSATLLQRCALQVRIPQPGGEESLNVAAAAAICLYESATRVSRPQ
jgi:TrmH family RNA methyltransferase